MSNSPIRIAVELEGIEPNDRLETALGELVAAANDLIAEANDTSGFAYDLNPNDVSFTQERPSVKSFSFGMPRGLKTSGDIQTYSGDFGGTA